MRRMLLLLAAVALLVLSLSPVVQAQDGEGKGPVDNGGAPVDAIDGGFIPTLINPGEIPGTCDFPVLIAFDGKFKVIDFPNGTTLITGPGLNATLTNTETLTSETFNITGSFRVLPADENGIVVTEARGRNLLIDPFAGFVVASGNFSFAFDTQFTEDISDDVLVQPLSGEGRLIDVCEALA